jgi:hypothetical protein
MSSGADAPNEGTGAFGIDRGCALLNRANADVGVFSGQTIQQEVESVQTALV